MAWSSPQSGPIAEDPGAQDFYNGNFEDRQSMSEFQNNQSLSANFHSSQSPYENYGDRQSQENFQDSQNWSGNLPKNQSMGGNFGATENLAGKFEGNRGGNPLTRTDTTDWASFAARTGFAPVGLSDDTQSPEGLSSSALPSSKTNSASSDIKQSAFGHIHDAEATNEVQPEGNMIGRQDSGNNYDSPYVNSATVDTEHDMHASAQPSVAQRARWELLRSLVRQHDKTENDHHQPEQPVYSSNSSPPKVRQHQFQPGPLPARSSSTSMRPLMLPQMVEDRKALNSKVPSHGGSSMQPQELSEKSPPLPPRTQPGLSRPSGVPANSRPNPSGFSDPPPMPPRPNTPAMHSSSSLAMPPDSSASGKPLQRSNALAMKPPTRPSTGTSISPQTSHISDQHASITPTPSAVRAHPAPSASSSGQQSQALKPPQNPLGSAPHNSVATHLPAQTAQATQRPHPGEMQPMQSPGNAVHSAQSGQNPHNAPLPTPATQGGQPHSAGMAMTPPQHASAPHASTHSRSTAPLHPSPNAQPPVPKPKGPPRPISSVASKASNGTTSTHPQPAPRPQTPNKPAGPPHAPAAVSPPLIGSHSAVSPKPPAASCPPAVSHPSAPSRSQATTKPAASHSNAAPHPPVANHPAPVAHPTQPAHPIAKPLSQAAAHAPPSNHPAAISHPPSAAHPPPAHSLPATHAPPSEHPAATPRPPSAAHPPRPHPLAVAHPPPTSRAAVVPHPKAPSSAPVKLHTAPHPAAASHPPAHLPAHPTVPHPPAPHPAPAQHLPAKPHPPALPHQLAASHPAPAPHPQAPSKPAAPQHTVNPNHPISAAATSGRPKTPAAAPRQGPPAHATKTPPTNQQKQHPSAQPKASHSGAAQHPAVHVPATNHPGPTSHPSHAQQTPPVPAHNSAASHGSKPAPHAQPAKTAPIPHTIKSTPTKTAHPPTQPHPSLHPNPTTRPTPVGKAPIPKAASAAKSSPVPHPPSHQASANQPPRPQQPSAQAGINKAPHGAPNYPKTTTHANSTLPKPTTHKPGSIGQTSTVAHRSTPQTASKNTAINRKTPSSQHNPPHHSSKVSNQPHASKHQPNQATSKKHQGRKPDFNLADSLPAILGQLAGGDDPDGEVDLEQEADNIVHLFLYGTALVFKTFISEVAEDDGWGQIDYLGYGYEDEEEGSDRGHAQTLSEAGVSSRSELSGLDHESEGNELD